ncbi:MAG: hypothetical protein IJN85_06005 [Oscillospiraceae bacterium]|nr:hypothetical protein [Oscillospiraceae bacterium]
MLEIHEKQSHNGYENQISLIGNENVKIIESYSSDVVDGFGIYAVDGGEIIIYDYDGADLAVIDGIIRTILFKAQFKGINSAHFRLIDNEKYDKLEKLRFISGDVKAIDDIANFMDNCKKCKELK